MKRINYAIYALLLLSQAVLFAADVKMALPKLTAAEIVDKNIAARGGLQPWRAVQAVSMRGKLEAGGNANPELPFVLEMKRPRKVRMELQFNGETAVQVYDGANGWKLRPFLNRHEVEPFNAEEIKSASAQSELDGPLIDYAAKGNKVELDGVDQVEGHDTYRLKVTLKNGQTQYLWIDSQTFLEAKMQGSPRRMNGQYHAVETYFRDYKRVEGLMIPHLLETRVAGVKGTKPEKITIASVLLNPKLDEAQFTKPK